MILKRRRLIPVAIQNDQASRSRMLERRGAGTVRVGVGLHSA